MNVVFDLLYLEMDREKVIKPEKKKLKATDVSYYRLPMITHYHLQFLTFSLLISSMDIY